MLREGVSSTCDLDGLEDEQAERIVELRSLTQVFTIQYFCRSFRETLRLPKFEARDLERALIEPLKNPFILEIVCRLLEVGPPCGRLRPYDWETELAVKCGTRQVQEEWHEGGNPLEHTSFFDVDPSIRAIVLAQLCEWKLEESEEIREYLEFARAGDETGYYKELPYLVGQDAAGRSFYHDGGVNARIYREDRHDMRKKDGTKPRWVTLCCSLEETKDLVSLFSKSRNGKEKALVEALQECIQPMIDAEEAKKRAVIRKEDRIKREKERAEMRAMYDAMPRKRSSRLEAQAVQKDEEKIQEIEKEENAAEEIQKKNAELAAEAEARRLQEFIPDRFRQPAETSGRGRRSHQDEQYQRMAAVGRRIKVFWPSDNIWYNGNVEGFDEITNLHTIKYDDGEEEQLNLTRERVEFLSRVSSRAHKPSLKAMEMNPEEAQAAENMNLEGQGGGAGAAKDKPKRAKSPARAPSPEKPKGPSMRSLRFEQRMRAQVRASGGVPAAPRGIPVQDFPWGGGGRRVQVCRCSPEHVARLVELMEDDPEPELLLPPAPAAQHWGAVPQRSRHATPKLAANGAVQEGGAGGEGYRGAGGWNGANESGSRAAAVVNGGHGDVVAGAKVDSPEERHLLFAPEAVSPRQKLHHQLQRDATPVAPSPAPPYAALESSAPAPAALQSAPAAPVAAAPAPAFPAPPEHPFPPQAEVVEAAEAMSEEESGGAEPSGDWKPAEEACASTLQIEPEGEAPAGPAAMAAQLVERVDSMDVEVQPQALGCDAGGEGPLLVDGLAQETEEERPTKILRMDPDVAELPAQG